MSTVAWVVTAAVLVTGIAAVMWYLSDSRAAQERQAETAFERGARNAAAVAGLANTVKELFD